MAQEQHLLLHTQVPQTESDSALWDVGTLFLLLHLQNTGAELPEQIHTKPGPFHLNIQNWKFNFLGLKA